MELNQDNYENYLLLYIDNELTASERAEVALFLASNPKQAQELKALQAVQLKPEYIEFTEKSSLYRFEEMNATLDPAFKKSLYKNSSSSAKLIDIKKIYWATGSIAAIALGIFFGIKT
ncbi:MAG: anti-sigma factor family protein, partial [Sediminibacterium sp.]